MESIYEYLRTMQSIFNRYAPFLYPLRRYGHAVQANRASAIEAAHPDRSLIHQESNFKFQRSLSS